MSALRTIGHSGGKDALAGAGCRPGLIHLLIGVMLACAPAGGGAEMAAPAPGLGGGIQTQEAGSVTPAGTADASDLVRAVSPFEVRDAAGRRYDLPFFGGLEIPRPNFVDIDADGDLDLFVQDWPGELIFFENTGSATEAEFTWRTAHYGELDVGDWARFVDMDRDGDFDLLAEEHFSHIRFFENRGSAERAEFVLLEDSVEMADGTPIFSDRQNIPSILDLDCNQTYDLFLGRIDGTLSRLEEAPETAPGSSPTFFLHTERFENIQIVAQMVFGGGGGEPPGSRHGANSVVFADWDADGDPDILWGDFFEPGLLFIENTGSCRAPRFPLEPVPIPAEDTIRTSGYNASALADIDGDGDEELFVGVLGGAYSPGLNASENFYHFERLPDGRAQEVTSRFLYGIDIGSESVPAAGDLDGDGDLELLVGSKVEPTAPTSGRLFLYDNVGGDGPPSLELADTLDLGGTFNYAPELADLDGDGDLDLVLGNWRDNIAFWANTGSEGGARFELVDSALVALPRGSNTVPALGDLDGDGDLDLLVGEAAGNVNLFLNEGSASTPRFVLAEEEFQAIDVGRRAAPSLVDADGDGDLDLFIGSEAGGLFLYRNVSMGGELRFEEDEGFSLPLAPFSTPHWVDLDGDGDADLLTGSRSGGVSVFLNGG